MAYQEVSAQGLLCIRTSRRLEWNLNIFSFISCLSGCLVKLQTLAFYFKCVLKVVLEKSRSERYQIDTLSKVYISKTLHKHSERISTLFLNNTE